MRFRFVACSVAAAIVLALAAPRSAAYIHFPPNVMKEMCKYSTNIRVLTVKKHDKEKGVILFELADTHKGENTKGTTFKHSIGKNAESTKPIFDWLKDGKQAVMFTLENKSIACGYVFIDEFCYSVDYNVKGDFWLLIRVDPELSATFHGTVEQLQTVTKDILAGKDVKVPVKESVKRPTKEEKNQRAKEVTIVLNENRKK